MEPPFDDPDMRDDPPPRGSRANFSTWFFVALAIALLLAGGAYWLASRPNSGEIEIVVSTPEPAGPVVAQIDGEVRNPGVYTLAPGARVEDGIAAAGGVTERADLDNLNRAALLGDGQRIVIPARSSAGAAESGDSSGGPDEATENAPTGAPVDLNTAGPALLQTLPGIGEVRAQAIIDWRDTNGLFTSVDDLLSISGIGPVIVEDLRALVIP